MDGLLVATTQLPGFAALGHTWKRGEVPLPRARGNGVAVSYEAQKRKGPSLVAYEDSRLGGTPRRFDKIAMEREGADAQINPRFVRSVRGLILSEIHRITVDPNQNGGRPSLRNLRIRVKDVLDLLAAGASREEILEDFTLLEPGDITAALEYAARQSDHPVLRSA